MENELEVVNIRLVREPSLYSEQILDSPQAVVELLDHIIVGGTNGKMLSFREEKMPHAEIPMVVVTNEDRVNGAATMFYPGVMDEIGEKLGGNFFVLPSSLHETIVVPNDGNMEYKALLAMVTEINATEVNKQDKLTDQVYHYDVTDKVFEKASRYEDRKQEKDKSHEKKSVLEKLEEKKDEAKATIGAKKTSYREAVSL